MNYAEALEQEAYRLARTKLIRTLSGTPNEDRLDGALARLDIIHAEAMEAANSWAQPKTKLPPLTEANVSTVAAVPVASTLATAAISEAEAEESQS